MPAADRALLIFAGGRATRLGGVNKGLLRVGGQTILERILDALGPLAAERVALGPADALSGLRGVRSVPDLEPFAGVLPALAHGLASTTADVCLAVAFDMPFASRAVFERLLQVQHERAADVVIPRTAGFLEPMHAVYRRAPVEAAINAALARGERRMVAYFESVRVEEVDAASLTDLDPPGRAFFNVNTPEDLASARQAAGDDLPGR
ncbi:MAG: molybdenum cofactor guanylyltransferase [Chloroflexi bacterium]|nr:molybdenum cofactor guanylyltransferase [Chloroflexota bacterium]